MPWVCLQFVIVVFPDHTHLLFFTAPFHLDLLVIWNSLIIMAGYEVYDVRELHYHSICHQTKEFKVLFNAKRDCLGVATCHTMAEE